MEGLKLEYVPSLYASASASFFLSLVLALLLTISGLTLPIVLPISLLFNLDVFCRFLF